VDRKAKKDTRGFCHHSTARLLCPRHMLKEFDKDREQFCHDVLNANRIILHGDWPAFLYPEEGYDEEIIDKGLLRGPFLVSVSIPINYIFTANQFVVLSTHFHRAAHTHENNSGKGPRDEVSRRPL